MDVLVPVVDAVMLDVLLRVDERDLDVELLRVIQGVIVRSSDSDRVNEFVLDLGLADRLALG